METQQAQFLLYLITTIAGVVWLVGIYFLVQSARIARNPAGDRYEFDQPPTENVLLGSMEVAGNSAELAAHAVSQIAKNQTGALGTLRILETADNQVTFQGTGSENVGNIASRRIRNGTLIFSTAAANRTRIDYAVTLDRSLRALLAIGGIVSLAGLVAIITGFVLMSAYIVSNANPAVRWQTLQMMQVVHFLWPPFLFGGLYRSQFSHIKNVLETFLHNLPYSM